MTERNERQAPRALVRALYDRPLGGEEIEALSFAAIDREAKAHAFAPEQWQVVRRMIHADILALRLLRFAAGRLD